MGLPQKKNLPRPHGEAKRLNVHVVPSASTKGERRAETSNSAGVDYPTQYFSSKVSYKQAISGAIESVKRGEAPQKKPQLD